MANGLLFLQFLLDFGGEGLAGLAGCGNPVAGSQELGRAVQTPDAKSV